VGASRSLIRLAPPWCHALSLHRPTTHHPRRPCRVLQASNSIQQLGDDERRWPGIVAPAVWAAHAPEGTRSNEGPASSFPYTSGALSTWRRKRAYVRPRLLPILRWRGTFCTHADGRDKHLFRLNTLPSPLRCSCLGWMRIVCKSYIDFSRASISGPLAPPLSSQRHSTTSSP
jgi:hypothetical protein